MLIRIFVDWIDFWIRMILRLMREKGERKKTYRQTIDESKTNKWQLSISRINLMIFDTIQFILSFMKLAPWSAFASYLCSFLPGGNKQYWTFAREREREREFHSKCMCDTNMKKKHSFPHHWFFDYTLQTLETISVVG